MSRSLTFRLETPSRKNTAVMFTNVTANAYQGQLNARFSKLWEIFNVCSIESLKYIREFHTPVCYYGDISTPRNVTLHETNCDWLFDMSVKHVDHGRALALTKKELIWCERDIHVEIKRQPGRSSWQYNKYPCKSFCYPLWIDKFSSNYQPCYLE